MLKKLHLNFSGLHPKYLRDKTRSRKVRSAISRKTYSHLISGIFFAHAVNTPLTTLTLYLEQTLSQLSEQPTLDSAYQQLTQALAQAKHLQRLMQLKHPTVLKTSTFEIKLALQEVIVRLADPATRPIITSLHVDPQSKLGGPIFLFQEALSCLIMNAFEASPARARAPIAITALETKGNCLIYICDSGSGMDWWTQQLITMKGFTRKKDGWGQGVTFAKEVIEDVFKGKLLISSQVQTGTIAIIKIPFRH